jgi:hypothetical protein
VKDKVEDKPALKNRGKSSEDDGLFGNEKQRHKLAEALTDMHYLLSRGYPTKAALVLAGNRYRLKTRQIQALQGMCADEQEINLRKARELTPKEIAGKTLYLDGFNIIILLETLLSGGYIFKGLDGCYRDISSVHGTYKKVNQTKDVLLLIGKTLQQLQAEKAVWIFDAPVSNSGKMKAFCYEVATENNYPWEIHLDNAPDKFLIVNNRLACSSDAWILNECSSWFNLEGYIIEGLYGDGRPDNLLEFNV